MNSDRLQQLKARLRVILGIDYKHKSNFYWYALAIPEFFILLFILYLTLGVMARHVYGYFQPGSNLSFPGKNALYYLAGEIKPEEQQIEELGLESELMKGVFRTPKRTQYDHFHFTIDERAAGKTDLCFICHGDLPHSEDKAVRSTLNMHTEFTSCVTCHTTSEKARSRTYDWYNYSGIEVKGRPFGTHYNEQGGLERTDDHYSKITPYIKIGGVLQTIGITEDSKEARDYLKVRDMLSREQQTVAKKKFHQDISKQAFACDNCHTAIETGVIPFEKLGFDDKRTRELRSENLAGTVEPGNDFYFPSMLREKELPAVSLLNLQKQLDEAAGKQAEKQQSKSGGEELNWWERRQRDRGH